ncbi:MAG: hypothetical protein V3574_03255 [Candidatus Moraniibacteriota bacterium]
MKKLIIFLTVVFLSVNCGECLAIDFNATWTHDGVGNLGFKIYQLNTQTLERVREIVIEGADVRVAAITGAPDNVISWWVCTAYSSTEQSGVSNILVFDPISGRSAPYLKAILISLDLNKLDDEKYRLEKLREIKILEEEKKIRLTV